MKWNAWTIGLLLIICGGGYYWYSSQKTPQKNVEYVTAQLKQGSIISSVSGSGNVIVDQLATVDPTITGTVRGLSVSTGDTVKKGQLLFTIENEQLSVDVAKATVSHMQVMNDLDEALLSRSSAIAEYEKAKKKDETDQSSYTTREKAVLKKKIDISDLSVDVAEQNIIASKLSYRQTVADAQKRKVVAPIDGTINEINIKNGDDLGRSSLGNNNVSPMIIGDLTSLKASVEINEVDISRVQIGQRADITFSALDGVVSIGHVEKIDSLGTVTQGVVVYKVIIGFDALDPRIKSNMSISASIVNDTKDNVLLVPNSAIKSEASGDYVQVLENNVPKRQVVELGIAGTKDTEVKSGLQSSAVVVTQTINSSSGTESQNNAAGGLRIPGLSGGRPNTGR